MDDLSLPLLECGKGRRFESWRLMERFRCERMPAVMCDLV